MKAITDDNFLLNNEIAKILYHNCAATMPIIDYHCHVAPEEIARDRRYDNITQLMLGGDHYKWRLIRANGEDETKVTGGESSDYEKFVAFAAALPKAVGNPVYHWTHLELQRYFDCGLTLSPRTADDIWKHCNEKLGNEGLSVRDIITQSNVEVIVTTDDPADSLLWHKAIAEDESFKTKVLPGFRPDKAVNIEKQGFADYIRKLGEISGVPVNSLDDLFTVLDGRLDLFSRLGCLSADHGLDYIPFVENAETFAPAIFEKVMSGMTPTEAEANIYKTATLIFLCRQYARRGWVAQLHFGALRNINTTMFRKLGPDTGFDAIGDTGCSRNIASLLDCLEQSGELPKTILFSLNPNDDAILTTIAGCFSGVGIISKVQHGSAWWYNDSKTGVEAQLTNLAGKGLFGGFIGMLTDSRSFLSYTRHEYFRRILCNLVGGWVENGEYPEDIATLGEIVRDISYNNVSSFFGFFRRRKG